MLVGRSIILYHFINILIRCLTVLQINSLECLSCLTPTKLLADCAV
jgi:hypothetical protein